LLNLNVRESRSSTSYPVRSHVQSGQSTPGSDNSGSDSSIAADDQALVQFESPERSKESLETDPLPAVHQPPFRAAVSKKISLLFYMAILLYELINWFHR